MIASTFLQLARSRRKDLLSLSPACLLRVSEAYAKAAQKMHSNYCGAGGRYSWDTLTEERARYLDGRLDIPFGSLQDSVPCMKDSD